ncbi:hypothetical protein BJX70DRAFT_383818 [Aspergillus crustosus]
MPTSASSALLKLPNEVLLCIFHQAVTMGDAVHLAQTCSQLYSLYNSPKQKSRILRSAANVPNQIGDHLTRSFACLRRLPQSHWYLRSSKSEGWLLFQVDYGYTPPEDQKYLFHSLSTIPAPPERDTPEFAGKLVEFLYQFRNPEVMTNLIVFSAAEYQLMILNRLESSSDPQSNNNSHITDLSSESTVIALALHCVIVCRDLNSISSRMPLNTGEDRYFHNNTSVNVMDRGRPYRVLVPAVTISRHKQQQARYLPPRADHNKDSLPPWHIDAPIEDILSHVAELSSSLLATPNPRHWPTVFYVILLLYPMREVVAGCGPIMARMKETFQGVLCLFKDLARYFFVCAKGGWVVSPTWNAAEYAEAVDHDELAMKGAEILRELWEADDEFVRECVQREDLKGVDGFVEKLLLFASRLEHY